VASIVPADALPDRERDLALLRRVADGDALAFRELTNLHLTMIVTYAARLLGNVADAEDVAQETFLRAWKKAGTYQPRARARTWLLAIAHNLAIDRLRRRKTRREESSGDEDDAFGPSSQEPAGLLLRKRTAIEITRALDVLPERQKVAILLCHEQGLSLAEVAEVLGSSSEAIESLLARGRRTLRALLSAERPQHDD
jgi:RNA polymerase sigma-70 factor (ECF subfamily)